MPSFLQQVKALNEKLTLNQKLSILALGSVILFGILFFVYMIQTEPYQLLFTDLDPASARDITGQLEQMDIPYELSDGGRAISVPVDRSDQVWMEIASEELPSKGRIGYEIFDQSNWGITDFTQEVNYHRALEGELERTIVAIDEILQARVHLVMEKTALFEEDEQPAKASVVIKLRSGSGLSHKNVTGIQNLVAFSVPGLLSANVVVVNMNGQVLSEPESSEEIMSDTQVEYKQKVENAVCRKVLSILEPVVGTENVKVNASVALDLSETEQTEEIYDPQGTVILSQQLSEEVVTEGTGPQGVPFQANDGEAAAQPQTAANPGGRRVSSETTNYEVSRTVRQKRLSKGSILRQSVAVVVNDRQRVTASEESGEEVATWEPRGPEEMARIEKLVAATIGFNEERGDTLTVENVSFPRSQEPEIFPSEPSLLEQYEPMIYPAARYLLIFVLFGLFYFMIFRPVQKKVFAYVEFQDPEYARLASSIDDPDLVHKLEGQMDELKEARQKMLSEGEEESPLLMGKEAGIKKDLLKIAESEPELVTQVIRSWLAEEGA